MTKPVTGLTVWGSNTTGTTTQLDNNFTALKNAINDFNSYKNYLVDTGAANAYVVALPSNITGLLTDGLQIQVKFTNPNSGQSVINYNSTGNANIVNMDGSVLGANQIAANMIGIIQYSNAIVAWMLQTPMTGNNSIASGAQMLAASSNVVVAAPGNLLNHPGISKAWGMVTGAANAVIVSWPTAGVSVIKVGTGDFNVTHGRTFSNGNYVVTFAASQADGSAGSIVGTLRDGSQAAGNFSVRFRNDSGTLADPPNFFYDCKGTLA